MARHARAIARADLLRNAIRDMRRAAAAKYDVTLAARGRHLADQWPALVVEPNGRPGIGHPWATIASVLAT
jgi:hypothetical protein